MIKKVILLNLFLLTLCLSSEIKLYTEEYAPYQFNTDEGLSGISIDIVKEIQKRVGDDSKIELLPWSEGLKNTLENKNSAIFSTGRTYDRESKFKWVGPIAYLRYVFFANKEFEKKIKNPNDARDIKAILVNKDDVSHQMLQKLNFHNLKVNEKCNNSYSIKMLKKHKSILWAHDYFSGVYKINRLNLQEEIKPLMKTRPILTATLNIAFNIDSDETLIKKWQDSLDEIKSDGTYEKILKAYGWDFNPLDSNYFHKEYKLQENKL